MVTPNQSIPGMDLSNNSNNNNYSKSVVPKQNNPEEAKKKFEKTKKDLEKLKDFVVKKYKFVKAIGILPPQSIPKFIEEEEVPPESKDQVHLQILIPDEKIKEIPKNEGRDIKRN